MSTDLTEEDIRQFLDDNPQFVDNWLSEHGMEEIATDFSKLRVLSKTALKFLSILSLEQDINVYLDKDTEPELPARKMNLFRDILKLVHSDIDSTRVTKKILQSACILLRCHKTSLLLTQGFGKKRFLISRTSNVATRSQLGEIDNIEGDTIHLPFGKGIVGFVAENECLVNIKEAWRDPRVQKNMGETDYQIRSILSVPVFDKNGRVIGVVKALNKLNEDNFDSTDENLFECFSKICALNLNNDRFFKAAQGENKRHQMLLKLSRCFSRNGEHFQKLVSEILQYAMKMLDCDNISIYLSDNADDSSQLTKSANVLQFLKGDTKVKDAPIDPRFVSLIERNMNSASMVNVVSLSNSYDRTKRKTKITLEGDIQNWIICVTIHANCNTVIGYMMFLRKTIDIFSENDINMLETFAIFCGLAIYNNHLYKSCNKIVSSHDVAYELLQLHSTCGEEEAYEMQHQDIRTTSYYKLYSYDFISFLYLENEQVILSALMFLEMNALNSLKISKFNLYRWILTVKKNYRPVPYHNWQHAVNVTQAMFSMLTTGRLQIYFKEFELVCLLVACLFHDIDHRGTNNAFQVNTASPLATLYNTSIMECHHINRSIMILENEDTNIFRNISAEKYRQGLKFIEKAILATDLVLYFEKRNLFRQQIEDGNKTFESQESVELLISMMMTAADLIAITKPWEFQKMTAMLIANEFFTQGDMETASDIPLLPLMDRNNIHEIPQMQVGFIDFVCTMIYKSFSELHEELEPLYDGMLNNRAHWAGIANGDEEFDAEKEYNLALKLFYLEEAISCTTSPMLHVNVATQTVLTYLNLEQEQQTIQTILSYPIEELVTVNDLTIPVSPEIEMIPKATKNCQTEDRSPSLSEAFVQTYVPATRTGEASPAEPPTQIFRRQPSTATKSGDYSESETAVSSLTKSSVSRSPFPTRRSSCFDELLYERRQELELEKGKSFRNTLCLEKPLSLKRTSRIILPPNPVRRESTQTRSSDYIFHRSSSSLRLSIGEISQKEEILFENISRKYSFKSETSPKSSIMENVLEPVKNENVREKSKDADTPIGKEVRILSPKKKKASWTSAYEGNGSTKGRIPVARRSLSITKDRMDSVYRTRSNSGMQKQISQNIEFRRRKCVKVASKDVQKGKRLAICVIC
uniref:Phosphodiesterase n=1 Tax=Octopus bimaculoides TaxID=37653 RepID=A0A0L8GD80_OCTBM|eukprot:XP_014782378.1 PREDICTED: cGMP-specific 3',5'-cyclic phosphodiesterase-like [Octopus bimaculoides]